jgi:hypothetical protein
MNNFVKKYGTKITDHIPPHFDWFSYSQEIPSRFKKDIVHAAKDKNGAIEMEALKRVLVNIGASNSLSPVELCTIFDEVGEAGYIQADRMVQIL